jgi:DNA-binding SARP family transcriptional activator/tetratricopeptide (TPR) repeat protein
VLRLRTFGGLSIERSADGEVGGPATSTATAARRRLAFLAVLAASGPRGVPRDRLLALFWPESDSDRARHSLDQTLYALKRDLAAESLVLGREELRVNPETLTSDVEDFMAALARGDRAAAVQLYTGPFLDGVFVSGAPAFERWAEEERDRLTREVESALETLATEAANRGDHASSVQQWQRLATMEPRKTRVVLSLMSELAAAGDRASALRHADIYHTLVRDDLDAEPNPAVSALADRLRREPAPVKADRAPGDGTANGAATVPAPAPVPTPLPRAAVSVETIAPVAPLAEASPRRSRLTIEWLRARTTRAYRVAAVAVALTLLLALSLAWVLAGRHRDAERAWILPADFENRTRDSIFDGALDAALTAGLQQSSYVSVFPRSRVQQTLMRMQRAPATPGAFRLDEALAREVAQREGIRAIVTGTIDRIDSSYMLTARLVDATTGVAIAAESRVAKHRGDVIEAVDDLVRQLRHHIGESENAIARHDLPLPQATTRSLEALRKYADGIYAGRVGQRRAAMELFREAVALDSDFAIAQAQLGASYYWNNDRPNGDAHFEHALRLLDRLTDRERLQVRASAESWRGNREQAIELRRALLALYPNDPSAWGTIGYDYMRLGRGAEAVDALKRQIARDSTNPSDYINLAIAYNQLDKYDDAIGSYRKAFALQPNLLTTENLNHEYGSTLVVAGHLELARAVYDSMLAGNADQKARGHRSLGLLAMAEGHYGEAIEHFRQAIVLSLSPGLALTEARNRLFLASAEQEKGWRDSASAQLRIDYDLFKKNYFEPTFLMYLGKALVRDNQLPAAIEVLDSLHKRARPDSPTDRSNEAVLRAEVELAQGNAQHAVSLLTTAHATDSSGFVRESYAHAIAASGDLVSAARLYESLSAIRRWYGWEAQQYILTASMNAGALYERAGDAPRARANYELVLSRWPRGDSDLVSMRASREALGHLQRQSRNLTPGSR